MPKDEEDGKKGKHDQKHDIRGTTNLNGQINADLEFTQRAEELLERLRSQKKPPEEEPEPPGEKTKGITEKHK
jgi:hypothetical protein